MHKIFLGKLEWMISIRGPRRRRKNKIKMYLEKYGARVWSVLIRLKQVECFCELENEPSGFVRDGEFQEGQTFVKRD